MLKAATGEIANSADLGGAEMHAEISGLAEYLAENAPYQPFTDGRIKIAE